MSVNRVKADVSELKQINLEIKKLMTLMKPLKERKKLLEAQVLDYMKSVGDQGLKAIKMHDVEVVAVEKKVRERMKKEEKENTAIQLLHQSGVNNARKVYRDMQELTKGKENVKKQIKLQQASGQKL
jgi:hypothetical protein